MHPFWNPLALHIRAKMRVKPRLEVVEAEREALFIACVAVFIPLALALVTAA